MPEQDILEPQSQQDVQDTEAPVTEVQPKSDPDKDFNDRFEKLYTERSARDRKSWEEQHLAPLKKQYEDLNQNLVNAELQRMKAMGWLKDEQPKALTQADLDARLKEYTDRQQRQMTEYIYSQRIQGGWREVSRAHPKLAPIKGFQDAVLARYAEKPDRDFAEVGNEVAKDFEAYFASRSNAVAEEHANRNRPDRRIVPSGRGAGSGEGGGGKGERKTVAQKLMDRLQSRGE